MHKLILLISLIFILPSFSQDYSVYNHNNYKIYSNDNSEKLMFILDFSNSMNEYLEGRRKVELMIDTMRSILPKLDPNISVGLRVYGHRMGFTPLDSCKASSLILPIKVNNNLNISTSLLSLTPRGMTPITYSLKQSVNKDFAGFSGKNILFY